MKRLLVILSVMGIIACSGNKNVDVHDVMTAMSKAELSITIATTVTGKVIQAYDKIMQLQI